LGAKVLNAYGESAEFQQTEMTKPTPAAGHELVRIAATSVNTVDTMIRLMGQAELPLAPDLPAVLGMDFAGTVDAVGPGVTGFAPGDEVYGCVGGLGDLQVRWPNTCWPMPGCSTTNRRRCPSAGQRPYRLLPSPPLRVSNVPG